MKTKVKYNKCKTCENAGWSMPQCAECNRANGYRYYSPGRPVAPSGVGTLNPEDMEADEEREARRRHREMTEQEERITKQKEEISRLSDHARNLEQSRDYWKAKAKKLGRQLREMRKGSKEG